MKLQTYGVSLALGAVLLSAACDDKTEIVIPEPLPDPITVAVTPANLSLDVGQTAQFVASVSGGAAGTVRTVTWASSNNSIATIDANGLVTAVAPGVTTVTATSTADNTARGAAALTVNDDGSNAPVTLSIKSITTGATNVPVDITNVRGQADVTLNLEGSPPAVISRVETLIDGVVVCSQAFSTGSADVAASDEAQAQVEIVCSVPTQAFNATTGETTWKNGPHNLQARAVRPNGEVVATPSTTLIFNNTNFVNATFSGSKSAMTSSPAPRSLATAGSLWHSGDISVNLQSVNYGGPQDAVAQATVQLTSSGYGVHGLAGCASGTDALTNPTVAVDDGGAGPAIDPDGAGPLLPSTALPGCAATTVSRVATFADNATTVTFPSSVTMSGANPGLQSVEEIFEVVISSVTAGGQTGPVCINPDPVNNPQNVNCQRYFQNPLRVDNLAPRVTQLSIERAPNQYFGPLTFALNHAAGGTTPLCTAPCARSVDYGVGGQTQTGVSRFLAGPSSAPAEVGSGAEAGLAESATSNDYVFGMGLQDLSENARTAFATMTTTTVVTSATNAGARRFGWDATAPSLSVMAGPADLATNPDESDIAINPVVIDFIDSAVPPAGPSGFLTNPLRVKLERILPAGVTCHNPDTFAVVSCTTGGGFVMDDGTWPTPGAAGQDGYFRYTFDVSDAAGNPSQQMVRFLLEDVTAPTVGGVTSPSTITGGAPATFAADIADNVDLGGITPLVRYDVFTFEQPQQEIGSYGLPLLGSSVANVTIPSFMRSFQGNTGAGLPGPGPHMAVGFLLNVRDRAGQELRYHVAPWPAPPNHGGCPDFVSHNTSLQNCTNREVDIGNNVLAGVGGVPVTAQFGDFVTANGLNAAHGLFMVQAPSVNVVCNNAARTDCPSATTPLSTTVTATLTGPAGTFQSPFTQVHFYYLNPETHWTYIGPATVVVSDNTVSDTRTYTFTGTWNAAAPKVRPAGAGGTGYSVYAVGVTAAGDGLGASVGLPVTIHGN